MMRREEKLLTRAMLLKEVWNYKFAPQSNLVDVSYGAATAQSGSTA
jgi:two-component system OmpR family response regulator